MKKTLLLILGILFLISFVSAPNVGTSDMTKGKVVYTPPVFINYSLIPTVNNSVYWGGHSWSDVRWLEIDGSNANQNIDIGIYNFTADYFIGDGSQLTGVAGGNLSFNQSLTDDIYVPYIGADKNVDLGNNNFTVNGTTFHIDSDNDRVGVGTSSPGVLLEVSSEGVGGIQAVIGQGMFSSWNVYFKDGKINFGYYSDSVKDGYINYDGYLGANSQFRNLLICDGKGNTNVGFYGWTGNVMIGGDDTSGTLLQLKKDGDAYLTLQNLANENTDGGAETRIIFEDHSNSALAQIQGSHDGIEDDTKGDLIFFTHTGSALKEAMRLDSAQNLITSGDLNVTKTGEFENITLRDNYICNETACFTLQELNTTGAGIGDTWALNYTYYYNKSEIDNNFSLYLLLIDQRYNETQVILDMNASWLSTYNATYAIGSNVSWNQSKGNSLYMATGNYSIYQGLISNASYLSTYNSTYDAKADYQFLNNNFNGSGWINTTGNISASYFFGDGSQLTNIAGGNLSWNESKADDKYVPYIGADKEVDLGLYNFTTTGIGTFATINATDEDNALQVDGTTILRTGAAADNNLFIGDNVFQTADGTGNIGIGVDAGRYNDGGEDNTFIGYQAGKGAIGGSSGNDNLAIGQGALAARTSGRDNFALGPRCMESLTTGIENIGIGATSLLLLTTGRENIAIGRNTMQNVATSSRGNIALGQSALKGWFGKVCHYNIAIGVLAGYAMETGEYNIAIGHSAGKGTTDGDRNIFIGTNAGSRQTTGSNKLFIDYTLRADAAEELTNSIIYGVMAASPSDQTLRINAGLQLRTLTITASADNTDVSGVNIMFVNITSNIVLGGLTGGVDGQVLHIVYKGNYVNTLTVEDTEGVGDQDIYTHTRLDETVDGGGYTLVCDGSNWYDTSHARHV